MNTTPKALYPGLYGWEVAYQLSSGVVVFCTCFQDVWLRYFQHLREEFDNKIERAFLRFAGHVNPTALRTLFPDCNVGDCEPQIIDGKEFYFRNRNIKAPKLDDKFWKSPEVIFRFEDKVCEVCTGRVPKHFFCHQMYGSPFAQVYGAWVKADLIRQGYFHWPNDVEKAHKRIIWNETENKFRNIVGIPLIGEQFISETILFKTVAYLLNGHEAIHHYRAAWLGRQELDIFVPGLKLAVEYQGEQHFMPVEAWGGKTALVKGRLRDDEKKRKCEREGVTLVYFDYNMELTEQYVFQTLQKALKLRIKR